MTEQCALGAKNEQAIKDHDGRLSRHDEEFKTVYAILDKVRNRLPGWAVLVIAGLSGICSALITAARLRWG